MGWLDVPNHAPVTDSARNLGKLQTSAEFDSVEELLPPSPYITSYDSSTKNIRNKLPCALNTYEGALANRKVSNCCEDM